MKVCNACEKNEINVFIFYFTKVNFFLERKYVMHVKK